VLLDLRSIKVGGFEYMKDLKKLEEFHFAMTRDEKQQTFQHEVKVIELIYSWCAQNLPQLKLIDTYYDYEELIDYDYELTGGITPCLSGTSSLETFESKSFLPEANLPDLKNLHFFGRIEDPHFFTKICSSKSLTKLQLFHFQDRDQLYKVLDLVGSQLSSLDVQMHLVDVDYFRIFYLCPNLVKFELLSDAEEDSAFKERVNRNHVHCLEEVVLGYNQNITWKMPAGLLNLIFQAPNIRMIDVDCFSLTKEDCVCLRDVEEGRFQRLQEVSLVDISLEPECTIDDFAQTVKFLVCSAPKLYYLQMVFDTEYTYTDFNYDHHLFVGKAAEANKFLELVPFRTRQKVPPL